MALLLLGDQCGTQRGCYAALKTHTGAMGAPYGALLKAARTHETRQFANSSGCDAQGADQLQIMAEHGAREGGANQRTWPNGKGVCFVGVHGSAALKSMQATDGNASAALSDMFQGAFGASEGARDWTVCILMRV